MVVAVALYALRMFAITAFYHRYFSHHAFRTSRAAQFVFALLGASAAQRGPVVVGLAPPPPSRARRRAGDGHSPLRHGFLLEPLGWFMARENFARATRLVAASRAIPELRFLDRCDALVPLLLAAGAVRARAWLERFAPGLHTSGAQLLVWGFCISTVALYHATFSINSLAHRFGSRRYATRDDSRNNLWLALLTFGEGWHNNHHHYPGCRAPGLLLVGARPHLLRPQAAGRAGLVWDLRPVPAAVRDARGARARATA